jgi:hypothetical protein
MTSLEGYLNSSYSSFKLFKLQASRLQKLQLGDASNVDAKALILEIA